VVYEINCSHCGNLYIGETGRTIGSRIKEHLSMDNQTVFKHIMSHKRKKDKPNQEDIILGESFIRTLDTMMNVNVLRQLKFKNIQGR
jgi:hypothetical protein